MKRFCIAIALVFTFVAGISMVPFDASAAKTASKDSALESAVTQMIDINTADEAALSELPGVGPKTAAAIADYRRQHGKFKSLDDLEKIKGIGGKKLAKLKPYLKQI